MILFCPITLLKFDGSYFIIFSKTLPNIQTGLDLFVDLIKTMSPTFILFSRLCW